MANRYGTEGDDVLDGTFVADNIAGYGGNDLLRGFAGNDVLWGGYGDDRMDGGPSADTFYGLSGFDAATYEYATSGVIIRLDGAVCQNGVAQGDKLYSVEEVVGSSFNDQLFGLDGFAETLRGGDGDDTVLGSTGADDLRGGAGSDTLAYVLSDSGVAVNLATSTASGGDAQGDTIAGFEHLSGGYGNDTLVGNNIANRLSGGAGNDTLRGGGGADVIGGGIGRDQMWGGSGADTFFFSSPSDSGTTAATRDRIMDFSRSQGDRIDLGIDDWTGTPGIPNPFEFRGQNGFTDERQVRFVHQDGDTIVQVNLSGASGAELAIQIEGIVNLQASDFILG
ncbi:MAG: calcium-binding protein [Geminicoccaceae bacterium]